MPQGAKSDVAVALVSGRDTSRMTDTAKTNKRSRMLRCFRPL
jgi:hypothetical protein